MTKSKSDAMPVDAVPVENTTATQNLFNALFSDEVRNPPADVLDPIQGGRMKNMSSIKPQWRIDTMNKIFGIYGIGWYFEEISRDKIQLPNEEIMVTVSINLYIKTPDENWSKPIPSNGASFMYVKEKDYWHVNEECWKMATTDAFGKATSFLGLGANIYLGKNKENPGNISNNKPDLKTPDYYQKMLSIHTDTNKLKAFLKEINEASFKDIIKKMLVDAFNAKIQLLDKTEVKTDIPKETKNV